MEELVLHDDLVKPQMVSMHYHSSKSFPHAISSKMNATHIYNRESIKELAKAGSLSKKSSLNELLSALKHSFIGFIIAAVRINCGFQFTA